SPEKFDTACPVGSPARARAENSIIKKYKDFAQRECDNEEEANMKRPDFPTPIFYIAETGDEAVHEDGDGDYEKRLFL
ncbi:hypothetical protein Tco_1308330, partial [Tanacetum coccineum]